MKNLAEVKESLVQYWSIDSQDERDHISEQVRIYLEAADENQLINEVRCTFEQNQESGISVIYGVMSKNAQKWGRFLTQEYVRAYEEAVEVSNPKFVLECFEDIIGEDISDLDAFTGVLDVLVKYCSHPNAVIRWEAALQLGCCLDSQDLRKYSHYLGTLQSKLNDSDWRVRYITKLCLQDLKSVPADYKPSFLDRLRFRFLKGFE